MKVNIKAPADVYGITTVEPGDTFRYANGKRTDQVFLAMSVKREGYNVFLDAKNMNTGEIHRMCVNTNKERVIQYVEMVELTVRDVGHVSRKDPVLENEDDSDA